MRVRRFSLLSREFSTNEEEPIFNFSRYVPALAMMRRLNEVYESIVFSLLRFAIKIGSVLCAFEKKISLPKSRRDYRVKNHYWIADTFFFATHHLLLICVKKYPPK